MSTPALNEANTAAQQLAPEPQRRVWHGVLVGVIPLGLLTGMVAITLLVTALARQLAAGAGFLVQQQTTLMALIVGLAFAIVVYVLAIWRVLRHVKSWQREGTTMQANAALWALTTTALISVLPVLLALLFPQQPAP